MKSPNLTPAAIKYAWERLWSLAGAKGLNIPRVYGSADTPLPKPGIIITPTSPENWSRLLNLPPDRLDWLPLDSLLPRGQSCILNDPMPDLFPRQAAQATKNHQPVYVRKDGTIVFNVDLIAMTLFMLSRWEETVIPIRDQHNRFPATASVAYKQGFLDRPIVDEYAMILQAWIQTLIPTWQPPLPQFQVKLTHDIDHIRLIKTPWALLRQTVAEGVKRRRPASARNLLSAYKNPVKDPSYQGICKLADISETYKFKSAFYFMATMPGPQDSGYQLSLPYLKSCIRKLQQHDHEIGFHAGYTTFDNSQKFAIEKDTFQRALGIKPIGGRQHYLRFLVPTTWQLWEQEGFIYDASMGYADHVGFRCGTCHPFHPFDLDQQRQMKLLEYPLIVMDQTLKSYQHLTPQQGVRRALKLAQRCKQVGGVFTMLWHNTSMYGNWLPWVNSYTEIVAQLAAMR